MGGTRDDATAVLEERADELEAVRAALASAHAGAGRLVVLEGPGGIGKSALLHAAARTDGSRPATVLSARASDLEREFAFGVALQWFEPVLAGDAAATGQVLRGAAELASPLFRPAPEMPRLPTDNDAFSLIHGLYWLTANLAEAGPILLTLDDAHWADRASLRFLLYLAERIDGLPLAVVVAVRRPEPDAPEDLLSRLRANRHAETLTLQPLSTGAVRTMAQRSFGDDLSDEFATALHEASVGNPLLATELIAALRADGVHPTSSSVETVREVTPRRILDRVTARLDRLTPSARALVNGVAVLGDDAEVDDAAAVGGVADDDLPALARQGVETGLLQRMSSGGLALSHPIVRDAVYDAIPPERRAEMHRRAVRVLAAGGAPPERIAAHILETTPEGDSRLIAALWPAAARAVMAGSPASAVRYLRRGLDEPPPDDVLAEYLVDLGLAELASADHASVDHLREALRRTPSRARRADILYRIGRTLRAYGRYLEAADAFRRGLEQVPSFRPELALALESGYVSVARLQVPPAPDVHTRTGAIAEAVAGRQEDPTPHERAALAEVAYDAATCAEPREAVIGPAHRALGSGLDPTLLRDEAGAAEIAVYTAAAALIWADEFEEADTALTVALDAARQRGALMSVATLSYRRAIGRYARGRLAEAVADAEQAVEGARYGWRLFLPGAHALLGVLLAERGELHRAGLSLDPAHERTWERSSLNGFIFDARGRLRLVLGDWAAAASDFRRAGEVFDTAGIVNPSVVAWRSGLALALARLGEQESAVESVQKDVELARRTGARRPLGAALRVLGIVMKGDAGLEALEQSHEVLASSGAVLEQARTEVQLGAALRRAGRRKDAVVHLRKGRAMAEATGAVLLEHQAHQELRAAGGRPRRTAVTGPGALTPSEVRVAHLAAYGLSNREIAERLFVSVKAVEWHLSNAYAKLHIRRRAELAGALRAADLEISAEAS